MRSNRFCIAALAGMLALTGSALASEREGHGGRVWVCQKPGEDVKVELLDYELGTDRWELEIDLGDGQTELEKIDFVLNRLERVDPMRARRYRAEAARFMSRAQLVEEDEFTELDDMDFVIGKRDHCDLKQVVYQVSENSPFSAEKRVKFRIAGSAWKQMNAETRAGLMLHEIVYEDSINQGQEKADPAIYVNAFMGSRQMETMTREQWEQILREASFGLDAEGFLLEPSSIKRDEKGRITEGRIRKTGDPELNYVLINGKRHSLKAGSTVVFYPEGMVAAANLENDAYIRMDGVDLCLQGRSISLYPNGSLMTGALCEPKVDANTGKAIVSPVLLDIEGGSITLWPGQPVLFGSDGKFRFVMTQTRHVVDKAAGTVTLTGAFTLDHGRRILSGYLVDSTKLRTSDGKVKKYGVSRRGRRLFQASGAFYRLRAVYFDAQGLAAAEGIYPSNIIAEGSFIKVDRQGDKMKFQFCTLMDQNQCEPMGAREWYSSRDVRKFMSWNVAAYIQEDGLWENTFGFRSYLVGSGLLFVPMVAVLVAGGPFGWVAITSMSVGGLLMSTTPLTMPWAADRDKARAHDRAVKRLIKYGYLTTDRPMTDVRKEIEESLNRIP